MRGLAATIVLLFAWPAAAQTEAERLIEAGHWKRARAIVEANAGTKPDALTEFLLSQIHNAFGDRDSPLPLAEKAVALDGGVAKYHRQVAEATGVMAQHSGIFQQLLLARRFRHEIEIALSLDGHDLQALRDLMEFYLLAPGIAGGDKGKARETAERIMRVDGVQGLLAQARLAEAAGDPSRQQATLRKAVDSAPSHYRARIALAAFLLAHGSWEGARQEAEAAVRIDDSRVDAHSLLAAALARLGRTADLEGELGEAERLVPDDLSPDFRAAEALAESNRNLDAAQRYLRRYLSCEPEGNAPTLEQARTKLQQILAKPRAISESRGTHGPG